MTWRRRMLVLRSTWYCENPLLMITILILMVVLVVMITVEVVMMVVGIMLILLVPTRIPFLFPNYHYYHLSSTSSIIIIIMITIIFLSLSIFIYHFRLQRFWITRNMMRSLIFGRWVSKIIPCLLACLYLMICRWLMLYLRIKRQI